MSSARKKRFAFIATILRGTLLSRPADESCGYEAFFPGGKYAFLFGAPPIRWWRTKSRSRSEVALSRFLISEEGLVSVGLDHCLESICDLLQELCVSKAYFRPQLVVSGGAPSLFECLAVPIGDFAETFYARLTQQVSAAVMSRLTVRPVMPRLSGVSFSIESLGVSLIERSDPLGWSKYVPRRYRGADWDAQSGAFKDADLALGPEPFTYLAVGIESGTSDWCRDRTDLKMRMLLAVVVSHFFVRRPLSLQTVLAPPPVSWIQFSEHPDFGGMSFSTSDPLLPCLADNLEVCPTIALGIKAWFDQHERLQTDLKARAEKCAFYINLAMNARSMSRFLFYYIALDALFGRRGDVERTIGVGVRNSVPELADRFSWIADLRNEIVHGGSRSLKEWGRYDRYIDHFDSLPEHDIEAMAFRSLNRHSGAPT